MGVFDFLTGNKPAPAGVPKADPASLRTMLLALNRDSAPWQIRDGAPEGADLVAEWKIVDARWYEVFAKASLGKVFKVMMKLDDANGVVRALDQEFTVEWRAGVPALSMSKEAFQGQKVELSFGSAFGFKEDLGAGQIYSYKFATKEIKQPLQDAVAAAGWSWKGVTFGKL